jgi:hypothetical protein
MLAGGAAAPIARCGSGAGGAEVSERSAKAKRRAGARRRSRRPPPGSAPGALAEPAGEPPPRMHALWYDLERQGERALADPGEIPELLADPALTVWLDVEGLGNLDVVREPPTSWPTRWWTR